jgi:hypothetical protein
MLNENVSLLRFPTIFICKKLYRNIRGRNFTSYPGVIDFSARKEKR